MITLLLGFWMVPAVKAQTPYPILSFAYDEPPHVRIVDGDLEWQLWYLNIGTRSEGLHGRLYRDGQELLSSDNSATIKGQQLTYVWHADIAERTVLWDRSGWLPEDVDFEQLKKSKYVTHAGYAAQMGQTPAGSGAKEKDKDILYGWKFAKSEPYFYDLRLDSRWLADGEPGQKVTSAFGEHEWQDDPAKYGATGWVLVKPLADE